MGKRGEEPLYCGNVARSPFSGQHYVLTMTHGTVEHNLLSTVALKHHRNSLKGHMQGAL